jgi:hypothetical protein
MFDETQRGVIRNLLAEEEAKLNGMRAVPAAE